MGLVVMGFVSTEQTVAIIEAVGEAMPDPTPAMRSEPNMAFWPLLAIAVVPVILAPFIAMWVKKRLKK
jgi:hypothetical protein